MSGRLRVEVHTDGAAFYNDVNGLCAGDQLALILTDIAHELRGVIDGPIERTTIRDANGNRVGTWRWEDI